MQTKIANTTFCYGPDLDGIVDIYRDGQRMRLEGETLKAFIRSVPEFDPERRREAQELRKLHERFSGQVQ